MLSNKQLINLCNSLSTMLHSGIQVERALELVAKQTGSPALRSAMRDSVRRIKEGASLTEAFTAQKCMPPLLLLLVDAGERSGSLDRVLAELARLFELNRRLWRQLLSRITFPVIEYVLAIAVLALVTFILSTIQGTGGGAQKAVLVMLAGYGAPIALIVFYFWIFKPLGGSRPFHEALLKVPVIGRVVQSICLARFSLVLYLMYEAAFPTEEALKRSFSATGNAAFAARGPAAAAAVAEGSTLTGALTGAEVFPREYLEVISVAEESGMLSERLNGQAESYAETSESQMGAVVTVLSVLIWLCVAAFIAYFIFTIFLGYIGAIKQVAG